MMEIPATIKRFSLLECSRLGHNPWDGFLCRIRVRQPGGSSELPVSPGTDPAAAKPRHLTAETHGQTAPWRRGRTQLEFMRPADGAGGRQAGPAAPGSLDGHSQPPPDGTCSSRTCPATRRHVSDHPGPNRLANTSHRARPTRKHATRGPFNFETLKSSGKIGSTPYGARPTRKYITWHPSTSKKDSTRSKTSVAVSRALTWWARLGPG